MSKEQRLYNSVAPLRNVAALVELVTRVQERGFGLPGMAVFYGPSGYGKTTATVFAANEFRACQVEVKSIWTKKKLCEAILEDLGIVPAKTISYMVDQIAEALARTNRPLLVDEVDHLVEKNFVEILRDIHESSGAPVILIGEELLPQKLERWERVHGRIMDWVAAEPGVLEDVSHLAPIYCPGIEVAAPLKEQLLSDSNHSIRRICVNLDRILEFARTHNKQAVGLSDWKNEQFFNGKPPAPRRF